MSATLSIASSVDISCAAGNRADPCPEPGWVVQLSKAIKGRGKAFLKEVVDAVACAASEQDGVNQGSKAPEERGVGRL